MIAAILGRDVEAEVELVRDAYEALGHGDIELLERLADEHLAPGFELHSFLVGRSMRASTA